MKRAMIFMALLQGAVLAFAQNPQAVIREISGTVELKRPGSAAWTPARAGDRIETSTILSTGFKSMALLAIGNSTLTVRPLTRLSLDELIAQDNTETVNVGLRSGRISATVNPPTGEGRINLTVRSPTATASVRGTTFSMDPVAIQVTEGAVRYEAVTSAGGSAPVRVSAGQSTWVDTDSGKAVNPVIAAEQTRALPVMAGESVGVTDNIAKPEPARGSLDLTVELVGMEEK